MHRINSLLLDVFPTAKLIRLTGYRNNDIYDRAKIPVDRWKDTDLAIDDAVRWIDDNGWLGFVIPDRHILVDVDNKLTGEALYNGLRRGGIESISIETPRGYQFLFRDAGKVKSQATKILTISGLTVDYRLAGKGYCVLPVPGMPGRYLKYSPYTVDKLNVMPLIFAPVRSIKAGEQYFEIPIIEGARNDTLFKSACLTRQWNIQYRLGFTEEDRLRLLNEMNSFFCNPQLDIKEIENIFRSAESYVQPTLTAVNESYLMPLMTLRELYDQPDENITWAVDGIFRMGGFSVIGSKPKVGKSTLARNLAYCVAIGMDFLGRSVTQGPVIYYALEEIKSEVKRHFQDLGASGEEDIHIYAGGTTIEALNEIRKAIDEIEPMLVIIDPLFRLVRVRDGNDYVQVTQALDPILRIARDTGTHILCVHHTTKSSTQDDDSMLGSTAIFGSVDTQMILRKTEHHRTVRTTQRYGQDLEECILVFDDMTRRVSLGNSMENERLEETGIAIYEFLSEGNSSLTEAEILPEIKVSQGTKVKALRQLLEKGLVSRTGKGGKGDPYKYSCILVPTINTKTTIQEKVLTKPCFTDVHDSCSVVPDIYTGTRIPECDPDDEFVPEPDDLWNDSIPE